MRIKIFESYLQSTFNYHNKNWEQKTLESISLVFGRGRSKHRPRNDRKLFDFVWVWGAQLEMLLEVMHLLLKCMDKIFLLQFLILWQWFQCKEGREFVKIWGHWQIEKSLLKNNFFYYLISENYEIFKFLPKTSGKKSRTIFWLPLISPVNSQLNCICFYFQLWACDHQN